MIRGGLRTRLIADSMRLMVVDSLYKMGWFGTRRHEPIVFVPKPRDWDLPVAVNSFAVTPEHESKDEGGLGNEPADKVRYYVDFFAQNDAVADHFAYDVSAILLGQLPDIGRIGTECTVYDLREAAVTPLDVPVLTQVDITRVRVDRPTGFPMPWQRHWIAVSCVVEDDYLDESETASFVSGWADIDWATIEPILRGGA